MNKQKTIQNNIHYIFEKIENCCNKIRADKNTVELMAVTKTVESDDILIAHKEGIKLFGENYIQQAVKKLDVLYAENTVNARHFHFIGHLQSNKLNKAMQYFSSIDAVDSLDLAEKIDRKSSSIQDTTSIYLEVNTSNEPAKHGFSPDDLLIFIDKIVLFKHIQLMGLMTMGPLMGNEKEVRSSFALLRKLKEAIEARLGVKGLLLSMGMSNDYEWAIMEGSNMIRIGRGIFGEESIKK